MARKFTEPAKVKRRNSIAQAAQWKYKLVHAVVRDKYELTCLSNLGVETKPYDEVLAELRAAGRGLGSSVAAGIVEIINYTRD